MSKYFCLAIVIVALAIVTPCFAWGEVGHRVVGRVAASLLKPVAQCCVATLLDVDDTKAAVANALSDAISTPGIRAAF